MVISPTYGSCFSINSNLTGNAASLWKSSLPGPNLGLHMELNLGQEEYMNNGLTRRAGARLNKHVKIIQYYLIFLQRVTFHNSSIRPLVDEFGHNIKPSTSTSFALEAVSDKN